MLYINSLLWKYKYFFYCPILPGTYPSLSRFFSCRKECRHFSFCTKGCPATLLINSSNPCRLSSMKSGSNIPSSFANIDSCFPNALPGSSLIYSYICKGVYVLCMYYSIQKICLSIKSCAHLECKFWLFFLFLSWAIQSPNTVVLR